MLDDFFVRAMLAGLCIAVVAGPLGCFVVWRKMAYFGATLSHSALLGVALALLVNVDPVIGVLILSFIMVPVLAYLERNTGLSSDSQLGILAHGTLALGLVLFGLMTWVRVDLTSYLFGDILAVSKQDLVLIFAGGAIVLGLLARIWRPLIAATVNAEIAAAEDLHPERAQFTFMLLVAGLIALGMKVVGVLLIVSLLIIPPAAARALAKTPEQMVIGSVVTGTVSVVVGLYFSRILDVQSGPSIVLAALALFGVSILPVRRLFGLNKEL